MMEESNSNAATYSGTRQGKKDEEEGTAYSQLTTTTWISTHPPPPHCPPGLIWGGDSVNGVRFSLSSIHAYRRQQSSCSSLLALFWFDRLRFNGASPYGLGRGDGGFVWIWAVASCLVVWGRGVMWGFSPLIEPRHFADLRGFELLLLLLLLLLLREELMSGLEHLGPLLCLQWQSNKLKSTQDSLKHNFFIWWSSKRS